ncbi:hypothetical protein [Thermus antranikianii]|uniref:hypothetical protein n=1 Tax=Thermus antranikianii TaxID=88190 RepID=UPI0023533E26|nr:hypothetical protein [Thermus antranikianii]
MYVADRGFDDRKVFGQVLALGEEFVVRVYRDRKLGEGVLWRRWLLPWPFPVGRRWS